MDEVNDFIKKSMLSRQLVREEKIFLTDEARDRLGVDVHYYVKEVVDPQITIREEDLARALEMARQVGFKQGTLMVSIE